MPTGAVWGKRIAGLLLGLCLLICGTALPSFAVTQQVAVAAYKAVYTDGEQLQMQARLVPPQDGVTWVWECRLAGASETTVVSTTDKITLELTMAYHGAVLYPVATMADGTVVRGPEKTLVVERYCIGLEIGRMPTKSIYAPEEAFDPTGLQILARMSDGSRQNVTDACSYAPLTLALDGAQVLATCVLRRENGEMAAFECSIPITIILPEQPGEEDGDQNGNTSGGRDPAQGGTSGSPENGAGDQTQQPGAGQTPDHDQNTDGSGASGGTGDENGDAGSGGEGSDDGNQQSPETPDQGLPSEKPVWSKDTGSGVILGLCLLTVCAVLSVALCRSLRNVRQDRGGEPPES